MYFAIGMVLAILWAIVNPYVFADASDPRLLATLTTPPVTLLLGGGGYAIDRARKKRAERVLDGTI